jgi:Type IV secretion system pilin
MTKLLLKFLTSIIKGLGGLAIVCLVFVAITQSISVSAETKDTSEGLGIFQVSEIRCIFYQKPPSGQNQTKFLQGCKPETSLLSVILKFLQDIAPFVTVILIIIGGYEYFVDNEAKKTSAKSTIFSAISGYIVILLAQPIADIVQATFDGDSKNPIKTEALERLFNTIINTLINLSSIVAVVCIVLAGYAYFLEFFVNNGKQEGKLRGQDLLSAGILGLIVTTLAKPIVGFIKDTLTSKGADINVKSENITILVKNVLANFLIPLSTLVALVFIVASAYLWLTAGESEEKVKNAKKFLTNALIGLVIVLLSTVIVQLITYFAAPGASFLPGNAGNATTILKANDPSKSDTPNTSPNPINTPVAK